MTQNTKLIQPLLERAVVKILIGDTFKGTGFFITSDYLLTAYHCVDNCDESILFVKSPVYGKLPVYFDKEKSFKDSQIDIAVLKLVNAMEVSDYLPLGLLTEKHATDDILAVGYPAEIFSFIPGRIHGFPERSPHQFFNNAMKSAGQSGGPVYHFASQRVVGLALSICHQEAMKDGGLAGRFDILLRQWPELRVLNQEAIKRWERRLLENETVKPLPFKHLLALPTRWWYYGVAGLILLIMLIFIVMGLNSQKTEGNCSPAISDVTGNISLDCKI